MKKYLKQLLNKNKAWVAIKNDVDPPYYKKFVEDQNPHALLIGCSDSRVSPSIVLGSEPGILFVHRNIAKLVCKTDLNFMSVLQFAIDELKINDIIILGHYGCGGIKAALDGDATGDIENWIEPISEICQIHKESLKKIKDHDTKVDKIVELNIHAQVAKLKDCPVYCEAIKQGREMTIYPWVYNLSTGLVQEL